MQRCERVGEEPSVEDGGESGAEECLVEDDLDLQGGGGGGGLRSGWRAGENVEMTHHRTVDDVRQR